MRICLIGNLSDRRCGFQNFTVQTDTALRRAGHTVTLFDGTYSAIYARQQAADPSPFFPPDLESYDVVHLVWNAMTMNHYSGADWASLRRPIVSWWDGGPSDASCPFLAWMQVRWSDYPRDGYHYLDYPVPDWVDELPEPPEAFTVGASSVRGDGIAEIRAVCEVAGWALNLPTPGVWQSGEDEIRRLARSTVNVCWYRTPAIWRNRASAPSMLIASGRPILINEDDLLAHLWDRPDVYHGRREALGEALAAVHADWRAGTLKRPVETARALGWTAAAAQMTAVWQAARG